jgi:hypothetical protein
MTRIGLDHVGLSADENQPTVRTPSRCYGFVIDLSHRNAHANAYLWKLAGLLQAPVCSQRNAPRPMNRA